MSEHDTEHLAAVAIEIRLAEQDVRFAEMCFACELEAMVAGANRAKLFFIGVKIGLAPASINMVLNQWELRAQLLHEAHLVLRKVLEKEETKP